MSALPQQEPDGSERRVAQRVRTLKRAKVLFNNKFSTFDCIVRNISATGALLTIDEAAHLPKVFDILIGEDKHDRPARLVYRRGMLAGIRFLDVIDEEEEQAAHFPQDAGAAAHESTTDTGSFDAEASDKASLDAAREVLGQIRRILPERLPSAITRNLRWA